MDLLKSIIVAASGLRAQTNRMRVIAENIANANSTAPEKAAEPYRRRIPTFKTLFDKELGADVVKPGRTALDPSPFGQKFQPGHPAADKNGYVRVPNVNTLVELTDMRQAQRTYQANINVVRASRQMLSRTIDILRS